MHMYHDCTVMDSRISFCWIADLENPAGRKFCISFQIAQEDLTQSHRDNYYLSTPLIASSTCDHFPTCVVFVHILYIGFCV